MGVTEIYSSMINGNTWGADIVPGQNVDIVLSEPYKWKNIKSKTFDCIICGQMLEHDEYFWLSMIEMTRILKPGGLCCIIAPSGGPEHKYPVDCYRYYPDGLRATARYAGLEVLEVYAEWNEELFRDMDSDWRDCVLICKRPKTKGLSDLKFLLRRWMINTESRSVYRIDYGNLYSLETTWKTPSPSLVATLYVDTGRGFNEQQIERVVLNTREHFKQHWMLPEESLAIRFCPLEGYGCIVKNLRIILSGEIVTSEKFVTNGVEIEENKYLFDVTKEPQIEISLEEKAEWIEIECDINFIG